MQQEPITIIVITIVYMQLFVQWHDSEWYAVTHQEVPVSVSAMTLNTCLRFFGVFLPIKNRPRPLPSTYFPGQYSVIIIHHTQKEENEPVSTLPPKYFNHLIS